MDRHERRREGWAPRCPASRARQAAAADRPSGRGGRAAGGAGRLVARHRGRGKKLLLIGHLDTVFEPDSPFQRWSRNGNDGVGPGAGDDKGGMAVIVAALRAMQAAGTLKNADITVFLTGDEEDAGPVEIARG